VARLDSTPPNLIPKLLGNLIERLTYSMENSKSIPREKDIKKDSKLDASYTNKELVTIKKDQENVIRDYTNLVAMRTTGRANQLDLETTDGKIKIGSLSAPPTAAGNLGEIAEGVFAAALASRFITRSTAPTNPERIKQVLSGMSVGRFGNNSKATYSGLAPNKGISGMDRIQLSVVLKRNNMNFLTNPSNFPALQPYMLAAIQYADRQVVRNWVDTIYSNKRIDTVKVMSDGISDSTSTKIDIKVEITNDQGRLKEVDINVSLKIDDTALFGQVSGGEFVSVSQFFSTAFQENMSAEQTQFEKKKGDMGKEKIRYIYEQAYLKIKSKLTQNAQNAKNIIGRGISVFATRDNAGVVDEENNSVQLIDLDRGEATIFDFKNVASKIANYDYDVKYTESTSGMPTITIEEKETNKKLVQFRSMYQNKVSKKTGMKYLYFRNYVEKGEFLKELIGTSALDNNVTSS